MNPVLRFILTACLLIGPPIYLACFPEHFTPLVDVLFSVFLTFLAYSMGQVSQNREITQQANDRWLPQAESVMRRLITLHSNVGMLSATTRLSCSEAERELSELREREMKAVRIKLQTECSAASQRLDDIANQLEDAVADWQRFVNANCSGGDCERIEKQMEERREFLQEQAKKVIAGGACQPLP